MLEQTPLSIMGRVALSKMVVLPRCLYVLQNSFCKIKKHMFGTLNSLLISLVWAVCRSRVKLEILKQDMNAGGLGVPDLRLYYLLQYAAQW